MALTRMPSPRMADAERAAEAVAVEGVSRVLLFGSVARGEAGPDSDIDLVVIHDDLDYSTRRERSDELARLARHASGCRVFVYVTDWPEWAHRSKEVSTSLECAITSDAVTSTNGDRTARWEKEIGRPETNRDEAAAVSKTPTGPHRRPIPAQDEHRRTECSAGSRSRVLPVRVERPSLPAVRARSDGDGNQPEGTHTSRGSPALPHPRPGEAARHSTPGG